MTAAVLLLRVALPSQRSLESILRIKILPPEPIPSTESSQLQVTLWSVGGIFALPCQPTMALQVG